MTLKEFGQCVEYNIQHNIKHSILGLGAPGVGKSQIIRQIGKKYGYKVIDIRLAQMSEVEIGGLIYPNETKTKTIWLAPEILPNVERDGEKTILLLDEITSCTKRVQVAAYQLILDRRIGQYQLPEGTFVVALGNREDDDGVYIQLAGPLADRFEIHFLEPNFDDWKNDFAIKAGVHPSIINYLTMKPEALHTQKIDEGRMIFATPRSWVRVSDILNFDYDIDNPVIQHKIIGNIGDREGAQFIEYCKNNRDLVSADDFIAGKTKEPKAVDATNVLIGSLINKASFVTECNDFSMMQQSEKDLLIKIINSAFNFNKAEYTIVLLNKLLQLNRPVIKQAYLSVDNPNMTDFIKNNSSVLGTEKSKHSKLLIWE